MIASEGSLNKGTHPDNHVELTPSGPAIGKDSAYDLMKESARTVPSHGLIGVPSGV